MDKLKPAIVVVAFNRPHSLRRLLRSVRQADFSGYSDVPLVISIDKGDNQEVLEVAASYVWEHGPKEVIAHDRRLGLRNHIVACGDLSLAYEAVIILEDDLFVSPAFYDFSVQALQYYRGRRGIGGISLYAYEFCEYADMMFTPLQDGYDNYFIQTASSLGQIWTREHWSGFKRWYEEHGNRPLQPLDPVPRSVRAWPESSWKKYFIKYVVDQNLYFVFPRIPLATDFGDEGTHTRGMGNLLQVPLLMRSKVFQWSSLEDSAAVYDAFFEPTQETVKRFCSEVRAYDFECDFYGTKELGQVKAEYLISSKQTMARVRQFGDEMVPAVNNVIFGVPGTFFSLAKTRDYGALPKSKRLGMIYRQQRILSGATALALGVYRLVVLLKSMVKKGS